MKPNNLSSFSKSVSRHGIKLVIVGAAAFAAQVACSDAPTQGGNTPQPFGGTNAGGTPANTAGTPATTAGTPGTAGSAGTFANAGTFSTGGMETGGTGGTGGATAGTGGTAAGTAGTGGTPPEPVAYCKDKTPAPLPFKMNDGFQPSGWGPDAGAIAEIKAGDQITVKPAVDACSVAERIPGSVGTCSLWEWTPDPTTPVYSFVSWSLKWDAQYTHPPICLADGAKAVVFLARGAVGGEKITVAAGGAQEVAITLTPEWKQYEISLVGVEYNTFAEGLTAGFSWKVEPPATKTTFFLDNIQFVKDIPAGPGGGEGGAGGAP